MSRPDVGSRIQQHKDETRRHAAMRSAELRQINDLFTSLETQLTWRSKATVHGSKLVSAGICSALMALIEAAPEALGKKIPYAESATDFVAAFIGTNLPTKLHEKLCQAYAYCQSDPKQQAILDDYIKVLIDRNSNPERQDAKNSEQRIKFQTADFWSRDETVDYISGSLTSALNSNITKTLLLFAVETFYEPENILHKGVLNISVITIYHLMQKPAVKIVAPIVGSLIHGVGYLLCNGCSSRKTTVRGEPKGYQMRLLGRPTEPEAKEDIKSPRPEYSSTET